MKKAKLLVFDLFGEIRPNPSSKQFRNPSPMEEEKKKKKES